MLVPKWLADAAAVAKLNQLYSPSYLRFANQMYGDANNWDPRLGEGRVVPCDRTALSPQMSPVFPGLNPRPSDKIHIFGLSQCSTNMDNLQVHVECFVLILSLQRETALFKTVTNRRFLLCFSNHNQTKQKRYTRRCEISTLRAVYIPGKHCRLKHTGAKLS